MVAWASIFLECARKEEGDGKEEDCYYCLDCSEWGVVVLCSFLPVDDANIRWFYSGKKKQKTPF